MARRGLARALLRLTLLAPALLAATDLCAQTFVPQGPNVSTGNIFTVQSGDAPPNGSVAGALGAVVASPTDANTLYVASANGGIWKTTNGGASWTALTSTQASLSIASLALDPTDPTARTLIAGTGFSSNGTVCGNSPPPCFFNGSGNAANGLLGSRDGGATWTQLGGAVLAGQTVDAVAQRGQVILAGTYEMSGFSSSAQRTVGGLYRSTDGGATFNLVSGGSGLPNGPVTSIVGDPANTNRLYAAVTAPNTTAGGLASTAVYLSNDAGATWAPVFAAANSGGTINGTTQTAIKVATGPNGTLAVAVLTPQNGVGATGVLTGLFYSNNAGATWTALTVPTVNNGNQAAPNLAIAIDPNNPRFVYVSGDRIAANPFTVTAFRIDAIANTATSLTDATFTANGSTVHADSRALTFDANGRLLLVGDGGIYARSQPQTTNGTWVSLNNLSVREIGAIAYDANTKRLAVAAQDTGVAIQGGPNATQYIAVNGGDGTMVAINDRARAGLSVIYTASQNLSTLTRFVLDAQGNAISPGGGVAVQCNGAPCTIPGAVFSAPFVLNKIDPSRIAIGGDQVYITQDFNDPTSATVNLPLTGLTAFGGAVVKIAYGTNDNPNAILAADLGGNLALSTTATAGSFNVLGAYTASGGAIPTSIVFDNRTQNRFYTADLTNVFGTRDRGVSFQNLTANLPANFVNPAALEFISNNGVNALLVGGVNTVANATSTVVVADSDGTGNLTGWRFFGQGLPNVQVSQLAYNPQVDVLAVGTFGRGAFTMYDVTSNFAQATVLQFGLANNDSNPAAAILTNGTSANRPLIKYGTGTLTIAGAATYTGGTTINNGVLQLATGGSIIGNVTFCGNAGDPLCSAAANSKTFAFNRTDLFTFAGSISGPGQVAQIGTGTTILTGNSTYTGQTIVNAGVLQVDGRISSQVVVGPGGRLVGTGTTGGTVVAPGAIVAPGNVASAPPIGTLRNTGALTLMPGSAMRIEVAQTADELAVDGAATIAGATLMLVFDPGPLAKHSVLLATGGGLGGTTFSTTSFTNLPAGIAASVSYLANEVDLDLTAQLGTGQTLTRNGNALAGAINTIFNSGGSLPAGSEVIFSLTGGSLSSGLASLSGEVHASTASLLAHESVFTRSAVLGRLRQASYGEGSTSPSSTTASLSMGGPQAFAGGDELSSALAYAKSPLVTKAPLTAPVAQSDTVFWAQGFGAWGRFNSDGNAAGVSRNLAGFITGVDTRVGFNGRAGLAAGYTGSQNTLDAIGSANVETGHVAAYGGWNVGAINLRAGADYAFHTISTDRTIALPGFFDRAFANYDGSTGQVFGEAGYGFALVNLALEPFAGAAFVHVHTDAGAERALVAGLNFASANFDVGYSTLGIRAASLVPLQNGMVLIPRASVAWEHTFGSVTASNVLAFQAAPTVPFAISGVPIARDAALVEAGLDLALNAHATVGAFYSGQLASNLADHAAKGKFSWKF